MAVDVAAEVVVAEVVDAVEVEVEDLVVVGETTVVVVVQILDLVLWMDLQVEFLAGKW